LRKKSALTAGEILSRFLWYVAAVLAGLPFLAIFPLTSSLASQAVRRSPLQCLMTGAIAFFVLPSIGLFCTTSLISLPLGLLLLTFWGILTYVSRFIVGLVIGTILIKRRTVSFPQVLQSLSIGLFIIYLALALPFFNTFVFLIVIWTGMGGLLIGIIQKKQLVFQISQPTQNLVELRKVEKAKRNNEEEIS